MPFDLYTATEFSIEEEFIFSLTKTRHIDELETKASSHQGQCIPAECRVTLPRRVLITMSIITMRSIF